MALPSNVELILMKWLGEDVQVNKPQSRVEALLLELMESGTAVTPEEVQHIVDVEIAKVVAEAPEDFDTLMEIADWIEHHEDDAAAMNSAIQANARSIIALQTAIANVYTKTESDARYLQVPVKVTYEQLKTLKNTGKLEAGRTYRITDYVTTTVQEESRSAGNVFDVIVVADSSSILNENARAIQHSDETTDYFYGQNLSAWKLKYDIENDTDKYAWADTVNGKGVIYELEDEYGNRCGYDFKNIQFKRYKALAKIDESDPTDYVGQFQGAFEVGSKGAGIRPSSYSYSDDPQNTAWCYTFNVVISGENKDYSLNNYSGNQSYCNSNTIERTIGYAMYRQDKQYLSNIVFYNDSSSSFCMSNNFGSKCHTITFVGAAYLNQFGDMCRVINFGDVCYLNHFGGNDCFICLGERVYYNYFGYIVDGLSIGNNSQYNYFGTDYGDQNDKYVPANTTYNFLGKLSLAKDITTSNTVFENTSLVTKAYVDAQIAAITDYDEEAF